MTDIRDTRAEPALDELQLDADEMRRLGYRVVDEVIARWTGLADDRAWQGASRAEMEPLLREDPPENGRDPDEVLDRALRDVLPVAGRIDHPRFFAFIPSSPTWPAVLADLLTTGFNIFQGTWLESAGPSQVELVVIDWFRQWLDLPETAGGLLTSGGSAANLDAIVTARHAAGDPDQPVAYASDQVHSALERAVHIAGFAPTGFRTVASDDRFRLDIEALRAAVREDRELGRTPLMVCANAGTTNTGAVDPLDEIADFCAEEGLWFHVDGAYGGFAVLDETVRPQFSGLERADSIVLDPHKWLFQPYETGCLMVRDASVLSDAFHVMPDYMQDTDIGLEHVNFGDRGLQLSRSFRALRVWMSIQMLGVAQFRSVIARANELARRTADFIRERESLELLSPASLGVVCYRFRGSEQDPERLEELNRRIQDEIVESGFAMISSTRLRGVYSLRICILNYRTTWRDVERTLERVEEVGLEMSKR